MADGFWEHGGLGQKGSVLPGYHPCHRAEAHESRAACACWIIARGALAMAVLLAICQLVRSDSNFKRKTSLVLRMVIHSAGIAPPFDQKEEITVACFK